MAKAGRSAAQQVEDQVVLTLEEKASAKIVTGSPLSFGIGAASFDEFPALWVHRGAETRQDEEHGGCVLMNLTILINAAVKSDHADKALDALVQKVDNAMQSSDSQNGKAIMTDLINITEFEFGPDGRIAECIITYRILYQYTIGDR